MESVRNDLISYAQAVQNDGSKKLFKQHETDPSLSHQWRIETNDVNCFPLEQWDII